MATETAAAAAASLIAPIERFARGAPRRPAIVSPEGTIDMGTLHARVLGGAAWLAANGVRPGMIVGLCWKSEPAHLQALYALARLGAIVLPLDRDGSVAERAALARRIGAEAIIGDHAETALPGMPVIVPGADAWSATGPLPPAPDRDTPWLFSLSAGSTGQQKAMLYSHRHEILRITRLPDLIGAGPEDRYLVVIEIGFNLGRVAALRMLHYGGTVVFPPKLRDPATLVEVTRAQGITWMVLTPNLIDNALSRHQDDGPLLGHVRRIILSGARVSPETLRMARARLSPGVHVLYGTNEVGPISILRPGDGAPDDSVGRIVPGIEATIVDDQGSVLTPDAIGLIRFRGDCIPGEYHRDPEATARSFQGDWFVPGDLATIDAAGFVRLKGRADEVINVDGRKVYPVEIEEALRAHPAVTAVAVIGVPHRQTMAPAAAVVVRGQVFSEALREHCRALLSPYKVPLRIVAVPALPTNALGKIDRARLIAALDAAPSGGRDGA